MQNVWVPPRELQLIENVHCTDGSNYTLFFPLEVKNKDYLVRGIEIVAMGIQDAVRIMDVRHGKSRNFKRIEGGLPGQPYDFNNTADLYYLTKHIIDNARIYAEGMSSCCTSPLTKFSLCKILWAAAQMILKLSQATRPYI
jgi:hypothetical protein